jgi:hypothetical protein
VNFDDLRAELTARYTAKRGNSKRKNLRERLSARLAEAGYDVDPASFTPAQGWCRSAPHADTYRWEAFANGPGRAWLTSYDTMTDCARYGVIVDDDGEVHAKKP